MASLDDDSPAPKRDLVTEISQGLRYMPGIAWGEEVVDEEQTGETRQRRTPQYPAVPQGQKLDDEFWAELDREIERRQRQQRNGRVSQSSVGSGGGAGPSIAHNGSGGSKKMADEWIRRMPQAEERCGIVLRGLNARVDDDGDVQILGEVVPARGDSIEFDVKISVAAYDDEDRVIAVSDVGVYADEFFALAPFSTWLMTKARPAYIRVFPRKL